MQNGRLVSVGGDVVTAINGSPINSFDDLLIYVALQTTPGQDITLTVLRNGKSIEIPLKLEARPANMQTEITIPVIPTLPSP
jgi:S1-C subfamily serine protease